MAKTKERPTAAPKKLSNSLRIKPIARERKLVIEGDDGNVQSRPGVLCERVPPGIYRWDENYGAMNFIKVRPATDTMEPTSEQQLILDMVAQWMASRDNYHAHGMSWKRGWLMHGGPGCGKTALMRMLAAQGAALGAVVLDARHIHELKEALDHALASIQDTNAPVLVLMEDIDKLGDNSELTEFLDGIGSSDGLGFVASTNYLARMSPRMLREGRFDVKVELKPPGFEDKLKFLAKYEMTAKKKEVEKLSMAELKEMVIRTNVLQKMS